MCVVEIKLGCLLQVLLFISEVVSEYLLYFLFFIYGPKRTCRHVTGLLNGVELLAWTALRVCLV